LNDIPVWVFDDASKGGRFIIRVVGVEGVAPFNFSECVFDGQIFISKFFKNGSGGNTGFATKIDGPFRVFKCIFTFFKEFFRSRNDYKEMPVFQVFAFTDDRGFRDRAIGSIRFTNNGVEIGGDFTDFFDSNCNF